MGSPANVCDIDRLQTTLIERDSDNLMFREGQSIGGVQNPIAVSGVTWPVSYVAIPWIILCTVSKPPWNTTAYM